MTDIYRDPRWPAIRSKALKRANHRCQNCGADVHGKGRSRVDHIQPVKTAPHLAFSLDNLRVLCSACDNARHSEKGGKQVEKAQIGADGFPDSWR